MRNDGKRSLGSDRPYGDRQPDDDRDTDLIPTQDEIDESRRLVEEVRRAVELETGEDGSSKK